MATKRVSLNQVERELDDHAEVVRHLLAGADEMMEALRDLRRILREEQQAVAKFLRKVRASLDSEAKS